MKTDVRDFFPLPGGGGFFIHTGKGGVRWPQGVHSPRRPVAPPSRGVSKDRRNCVARRGDKATLGSPVFRTTSDGRFDRGVLHPQTNGSGASPGGLEDGLTDSRPLKSKLKEWSARQSRLLVPKSVDEHNNSFALLEHADEDCTSAASLWKKALNSVRHLAAELDVEPVRDLPPLIRCGDLRAAVRGCFPDSVSLQAQLSIKTVQKLERSACRSCEPRFDGLLQTWREARFQPIEVDQGHRALFKKVFKANTPRGWNRHASGIPYIPTGNASLSSRRKDGGTWIEEEFSDRCRYELVFSSGKPRIVTMYSSYNSGVLKPLHDSLQRDMERMEWLLIGPPTTERIKSLCGEGDYLSFDYKSATDNIKQPYVEAAVEALIERADPKLDDDQIRCLRVLSKIKLEDDERDSTRGQPMGSLMSFPILSLINKTVVDMALADLLQGGQISFKEWSGHRLLVNGDDLLTKEPRSRPGRHSLAEAVFRHGSHVGLESNWEKTLCDPLCAEINSTLFQGGDLVKKTNAASLYMKREVTDVLGFALESTSTAEGFRRVVRANAHLLARQDRKEYRNLPLPLQRLCKADRKIRRALLSGPADGIQQEARNLFPVCPRPEGYDLSSEEEVSYIGERVGKYRRAFSALSSDAAHEYFGPVKRRLPGSVPGRRTWRSVKYEKRPPKAEDQILCVLASGWYRKQKERLTEEGTGMYLTAGLLPPSDLPNLASAMVDAVRAWKKAKDLRCETSTPVPWPDAISNESENPFENGSEWIALE